jgi:hypothetical protein
VGLVAGRVHTCAITGAQGTRGGATHVAACWGDGEHGQLGNGGTRGALEPVPALGLASPIALAAATSRAGATTRSACIRSRPRSPTSTR